MKNISNKIKKIFKEAFFSSLIAQLLIMPPNGCENKDDSFCKFVKYNEYYVVLSKIGNKSKLQIEDKIGGSLSVYIKKLNNSNLKIYDKNIDYLYPDSEKKSNIQDYWSTDSLIKVYDYVHKNGKDCWSKK